MSSLKNESFQAIALNDKTRVEPLIVVKLESVDLAVAELKKAIQDNRSNIHIDAGYGDGCGYCEYAIFDIIDDVFGESEDNPKP